MNTRPEPSDAEVLIDLDDLAERVRRGGVDAEVEQTGGNVAALFAGPQHEDPSEPGRLRYAAIGGPGVYGWGRRASVAHPAEFCVGPDDDGATVPVYVADLGLRPTADQLAGLVLAQVRRAEPLRPLDDPELRALGLTRVRF